MAVSTNIPDDGRTTHIMCICRECGHKWIIQHTMRQLAKLERQGCPECNNISFMKEEKSEIALIPITSLQASIFQSLLDGVGKMVLFNSVRE